MLSFWTYQFFSGFLGCRLQFINVTFNMACYILSSVLKILFSCRTKGVMIVFIGLRVVTNGKICTLFSFLGLGLINSSLSSSQSN